MAEIVPPNPELRREQAMIDEVLPLLDERKATSSRWKRWLLALRIRWRIDDIEHRNVNEVGW